MQWFMRRMTAFTSLYRLTAVAAASRPNVFLRLPIRTLTSQSAVLENTAATSIARWQGGSQPNSNPKTATKVQKVKESPKRREARHDETPPNPKRESWKSHKESMKKKFGDEGWNPRKKLSPDTMDGIRTMHASDPQRFTTAVLAEHFAISPEAIRRILKSKWQPSPEEVEKRRQRWEKRGERIWTGLADIGLKPPKPWRIMGVGRAAPGEIPKWRAIRPSGQALLQKKAERRRLEGLTEGRRNVIAVRPEAAGRPANAGSDKGISHRML